jgi:hypothetical protein
VSGDNDSDRRTTSVGTLSLTSIIERSWLCQYFVDFFDQLNKNSLQTLEALEKAIPPFKGR